MSQRSSITVCGSQVLGWPPEGGNLQVIANSTCAAAGSDPITVWIRSTRIDRVEVAWEVHFDNPPKLPDNSIAQYIQSTPTIGVADSSFVIPGVAGSEWKPCKSLICVSWLKYFCNHDCIGIKLVQTSVFASFIFMAR